MKPMWQPNGKALFDRYPVKTSGDVAIELYEVTDFEVQMEMIRAKTPLMRRLAYTPPGKYVKLMVGGRLMMSSTNMEYITNLPLLDHAKGDVLIGGLGLGLILHELAPKVHSVTVIEKSLDVIALVAPTVRGKAAVIPGDVFTWEPPKGVRFDTIYMDIWANMSDDEDPAIAALGKRYRKWLRKGGRYAAWGFNPKPWRTPTGRARRTA